MLYQLERAKRFELSTLTLARLCSTPELRPRPLVGLIYKEWRGVARGKCNPPSEILTQDSRADKTKGRPKAALIGVKPTGAGEEIRTLDPNLGKVMLYP